MNTPERRGSPRRTADVKVDYRTIGNFMTDYSDNVSKGGLFVATSLPLPVDSRVRLRISVPGRALPFCLDGVVRWTRPATEEEPAPGMGVEFVGDSEDRGALEAFVLSLG